MKRFLLLTLIVTAGFAFAEISGKVIVAGEDTTIIREIRPGEKREISDIGMDVAEAVDEALESAGIDRDELGDRAAKVKMIVKKSIKEALDDSDFDDEEFEFVSRAFSKPGWPKKDVDFGEMRYWRRTAMLLSIVIGLVWTLLFFIMWIISLIVLGKGLSKIARALRERQE